MKTYAALVRNVNVGDKRIAMPELRRLFEQAGCEDVQTYVQSGNVVFRSDATPLALVADLERRMSAEAGFEAPVLLRTPEELDVVVRAQPWRRDGLEPTQLVVVFCRAKPRAAAVSALRDLAVEGEDAVAAGCELYLRLPNGQGRSKLAAAAGRIDLGGPATARNWRTVTKLLELAEALAKSSQS